MKQQLYLTGFMGSGKTMIGKRLAEKYHRTFIDLDHAIEARFQQSVKQLFETKGEPFFRLMETAELEHLSIIQDELVVALGGGAACNDRNLEIIKSTGMLVYLKVEPDLLVERVMKNTNRPLLLKDDGTLKSADEIKKIILDLLSKREKWYEKADICVEINQRMEKDEVTQLVHEQIEKYFRDSA
jgi:shikimate kinase